MLKHLLVLGSTHKPFFNEILGEFHGVLEEFLKPGVPLNYKNQAFFLYFGFLFRYWDVIS